MNKSTALIVGLVALGGLVLLGTSKPANAAPLAPVKGSGDQRKDAESAEAKAKRAAATGDKSLALEAMALAISSGSAAVMDRVADLLGGMAGIYTGDIRRFASLVRSRFGGQATLEQVYGLAGEVREATAAPKLSKSSTPTAPKAAPKLPAKKPSKAAAAAKAGVPVAPPAKAGVIPAAVIPSAENAPGTASAAKVPPEGADNAEAFRAGQQRAQELAKHLANVKKYSEDRALVKSFQTAEQLKSDGQYGPKTAAEIADYGVVPPTPFYWPANWVQSKRDYRAILMDAAQRFPALRSEFESAAQKVTKL